MSDASFLAWGLSLLAILVSFMFVVALVKAIWANRQKKGDE